MTARTNYLPGQIGILGSLLQL